MAINTSERRRTASQTVTGLFGPGVTPNAAKDAEWRSQAGWGYPSFAELAVCVTVSFADPVALTITTSICGIC